VLDDVLLCSVQRPLTRRAVESHNVVKTE
jgi:hypothetical protein